MILCEKGVMVIRLSDTTENVVYTSPELLLVKKDSDIKVSDEYYIIVHEKTIWCGKIGTKPPRENWWEPLPELAPEDIRG